MSALPKPETGNVFVSSLAYALIHWRRQRGLAVGLILVMLSATLAELLVPVLAGHMIDIVADPGAVRAEALPAILWVIASIIALNLTGIAFRTLGFFGIIRFTLKMMGETVEETFARVQRLSTDWHASNFAGSTVRKITRGMWALDVLNDTILLAFVPSLVVLIGATTLFAWRWPLIGAVILVGSGLYIAALITMALKVMAPNARLANGWDTRMGGVIADSISCNAVVKGYGGEAREDRRLAWVVSRWKRRSARLWTFGTLNGTMQQVLLTLLRAAVLSLAAWSWSIDRASPGDVAFALAAFGVVDGYLREIGNHVRNLQRSVNDMDDLVRLHDVALAVADRPDAAARRIEAGAIRFEEVGFHYGDHAQPLYHGLDVTIPAGQKLALVGRSGSGKTTFVKLVQRLYDVSSGRITIDGADLRDLPQHDLRRQIAVVQQDPALFHRTLADNIAYGRPGASMDEIMTAARRANAHDFITRLPKGYATLVGERGVKLSGGERQRVAIARAFLSDAPVLILDEATSSLDADSEAAVQEAIERLMQGRTTIVIAHRLSTVRAMDRLLVFDNGRIAEDGSHEALMAYESGLYRRLFERQMRAMADELAA